MAILRREDNIKAVVSALTYLKVSVQNLNGVRLFDAAKVSEEFFKDFLNIAFGYSLSNLNTINAEYPAIDLGDETDGICVQVTSTENKEKLSSTIDKFCENGLNERYSTLKFVIIGDRQKSYASLKNYRGTSFDPDLDIIDLQYLCKHCALLTSGQLVRLSELCDSEIQIRETRHVARPDVYVLLRSALRSASTDELHVTLPHPRAIVDVEGSMDQQRRMFPYFTKAQMECGRSDGTTGLYLPTPPEIHPILGGTYNKQLEEYFQRYLHYLQRWNQHIELGNQLIRFFVTIENTGTLPAKDLRIFISAPKNAWREFGDARATHSLAIQIPERPEAPVKPKKGDEFDSQMELIKLLGKKPSKTPQSSARESRLIVNDIGISTSLDSLNQHLGRYIGEVYCVLQSRDSTHITVPITVTASNVPQRIERSVRLVVNCPRTG